VLVQHSLVYPENPVEPSLQFTMHPLSTAAPVESLSVLNYII